MTTLRGMHAGKVKSAYSSTKSPLPLSSSAHVFRLPRKISFFFFFLEEYGGLNRRYTNRKEWRRNNSVETMGSHGHASSSSVYLVLCRDPIGRYKHSPAWFQNIEMYSSNFGWIWCKEKFKFEERELHRILNNRQSEPSWRRKFEAKSSHWSSLLDEAGVFWLQSKRAGSVGVLLRTTKPSSLAHWVEGRS